MQLNKKISNGLKKKPPNRPLPKPNNTNISKPSIQSKHSNNTFTQQNDIAMDKNNILSMARTAHNAKNTRKLITNSNIINIRSDSIPNAPPLSKNRNPIPNRAISHDIYDLELLVSKIENIPKVKPIMNTIKQCFVEHKISHSYFHEHQRKDFQILLQKYKIKTGIAMKIWEACALYGAGYGNDRQSKMSEEQKQSMQQKCHNSYHNRNRMQRIKIDTRPLPAAPKMGKPAHIENGNSKHSQTPTIQRLLSYDEMYNLDPFLVSKIEEVTNNKHICNKIKECFIKHKIKRSFFQYHQKKDLQNVLQKYEIKTNITIKLWKACEVKSSLAGYDDEEEKHNRKPRGHSCQHFGSRQPIVTKGIGGYQYAFYDKHEKKDCKTNHLDEKKPFNQHNGSKKSNYNIQQKQQNYPSANPRQIGENAQSKQQHQIPPKTLSTPNALIFDSKNNITNQCVNYYQNKVMSQSQPNMITDKDIDENECVNNIFALEGIPNSNKSLPNHHDSAASQTVEDNKRIGQYPHNDTTYNLNDKICKDAFVAINKIRQHPTCLIPKLEKIKKNMIRDGAYWKSGNRIYKEKRPKNLIDDAINFLKKQESVGPLKPNKELARSAMEPIEHPSRIEQDGYHKGHILDVKNIRDAEQRDHEKRRMSKRGENIMYGIDDGDDIISAWIIDDNVIRRGHRLRIFRKQYTEIGFATGLHPQKGRMCVADFAAYFKQF